MPKKCESFIPRYKTEPQNNNCFHCDLQNGCNRLTVQIRRITNGRGVYPTTLSLHDTAWWGLKEKSTPTNFTAHRNRRKLSE